MTERFTLKEFGLHFIVTDNGVELTPKQTVDKLNNQDRIIQCHEDRIAILSELLDLADAIIDLSDDDKAKEFWNKKNAESTKIWEDRLEKYGVKE